MKRIYSLLACIIICISLLAYRVSYSDITPGGPPIKVTTWDAFGYYMYLPAIFTYHDVTALKWIPDVDKKYSMTGGNGYPAELQHNRKYVFKYLGGVALMEAPLYFIGDLIAHHTGYPPDGFSPPYQYALSFGVLLYCLLAVFLLRKILLLYFSDVTVAITLLCVCLATNLIQYVAIDNCQSHSYLFVLYVLVLYTTIKWHTKPTLLWAMLTGYIIGLATMSRPTEAIMLFIPLLWNTHNKEVAKAKWQMVREHRSHIIAAAVWGFIGVLPQLIYWQYATSSPLFDVGSKWDFLSPHFRVLLGWEKGWFVYTPITIFFVAGLFVMKKYPFARSAAWFCLLNIYLIIGWHIWRYGGSYSTRALVESYPVFALPFAAVTERISIKKWRAAFYLLCAYLLCVNLFQIKQYNTTVLHYDDMNREYYSHIYLNAHPTPLNMSLLDTKEYISNENGYTKKIILAKDTPAQLQGSTDVLYEADLDKDSPATKNMWLKIESTLNLSSGLWDNKLHAELKAGDSVKSTNIRLYNAISKDGQANAYAFYMQVPAYYQHSYFKLYLTAPGNMSGVVTQLRITELGK